MLYGVPQGRRTAAVAILSNSSRGTREVRGWGDDLLLMLVEKEKKRKRKTTKVAKHSLHH